MKIVFTGIPGCGKSKVMEFIKKELPDVKILNIGDLMFEIAKEKKLVETRDEIRKLPRETQVKIREDAVKKISQEKGKVIIDTHSSIKTPKGFIAGTPIDVLNILKPDVIAIREVDIKDVIKRRKKDEASGERGGRDFETEEELELHQLINRSYASVFSTISNCTLKIFLAPKEKENYEFEHAENVAKEIVNLFKY